MSDSRGRSLTRLWSIVEALRGARRGLTVAQLMDRSGGSRASVYRDLTVLRSAGLPIDKVPVAGEVRHILATKAGADARAMTPLQLTALVIGRRSLSALEGTRVVRELDILLRQNASGPRVNARMHVAQAQAFAPDRMMLLDRALDQSRCIRIRYRGERDAAPSWRNVEPVELRVSSQQPYLVAYDRKSDRYKTYKLARISKVQVLNERAHALATYDPEVVFRNTRGIWSGPAHEVAVRLHRTVARFVGEWPLHRSQHVSDLPNGDIIVRATIAGLPEALRWVLSWGGNAEVLAPDALRELLVQELTRALAGYSRQRGHRDAAPLTLTTD